MFTLTFTREELDELINGLCWAGNEGQDGELADPLKERLQAAIDGAQRPPSLPPTQAELTAALAANGSRYEAEPVETEE